MSVLSWTPSRHALLQLCAEKRIEFAPYQFGAGQAWVVDGGPAGSSVADMLWDLEAEGFTHDGESQEITEAGQAQLELWDAEHGSTSETAS